MIAIGMTSVQSFPCPKGVPPGKAGIHWIPDQVGDDYRRAEMMRI